MKGDMIEVYSAPMSPRNVCSPDALREHTIVAKVQGENWTHWEFLRFCADEDDEKYAAANGCVYLPQDILQFVLLPKDK